MSANELLMKTVIEAWGKADLSPARAALHDDVVWKSASTRQNEKFLFGGEYRGRAAVIALLSKISTAYYFQSYTAKEIISRGEIVWGLFDAIGTYAPNHDKTGRPIHFETVFRWRVRDGMIIEAQTFFDTALLLSQQGDL